MYYSIYPNKDNTITDVEIDASAKTGSNSGYSEILELYSLTSSVSNRGKSRILLQFDLNALSASVASGEIPSSSVQYRLRLKNANHYETLPSSFVVQVSQLSRSWNEGRGLAMYDEELKDAGYSNWTHATSLIQWTTEGGDFDVTRAVTQSFDYGDEDLDIDVSDIVGSWLTGGISNNGFMIKFLDAHETGSSDLYVKKFFSRHAHMPERRPRLEALWEDTIQDDRNNFYYKITGSLYYYRMINGQPQNYGDLFVDILNSSSTVVQTVTASLSEAGIYHASGVFVQHTSSTQIFRDVWFNASEQLFTGTFSPTFATGSIFYNYNELDVLIPNIRSEYGLGQKVILNVFGKEKNYAPALRKSGSVEPSPIVFKDAYYSIMNADTEEVLVNFSTGSTKYSKLSYDKNGNYFTLWTDGFAEESLYKIRILVNYNNQKFIFDKNWKFKIKKG